MAPSIAHTVGGPDAVTRGGNHVPPLEGSMSTVFVTGGSGFAAGHDGSREDAVVATAESPIRLGVVRP